MNFICFDEIILQTKLAISEQEQARGLMFAKWPPPVMAFVYHDADIRKYWMKNTYVPLDIVFCLAGKVRTICNGKPLSEELIGPDFPVDLVVELPSGASKMFNIKNGTSVSLLLDRVGLSQKFAYKYRIL